jgi:hypothetical protein
MICDEHERTIAPQMFLSHDLEAAIGAEEGPDDQGDERAQSVNEHVRLTGKIAESLGQGLVEIGGGLVLPAFHRSLE